MYSTPIQMHAMTKAVRPKYHPASGMPAHSTREYVLRAIQPINP